MADSGGHWSTLAQAQKLTQSTKIPGVFETDVKRNNPLDRIPVAQAAHSGTSIKFLREQVVLEDSVGTAAPGSQLTWTEDVTYDEVEVPLQIKYLQRKLDQFVRDIYGTYNDYRAQVLLEMEKGMKRKIGASMIYDDYTYGTNQFDGLHAFAEEGSGDLDIDEGEGALSLQNLRSMVTAMKQGCDELWFPFPLAERLNAVYEEAGVASFVGPGRVTRGINDVGKQVLFWDGIPVIRTDYLTLETANTGAGSDARTSDATSGTMYSVFGIKLGNVMEKEPGITLAYGGTEGLGDFYKLRTFADLEDYDAEGMRMVTYIAMLYSSTLVIGRIRDITDAAVTA
jgi:hypothetical protein